MTVVVTKQELQDYDVEETVGYLSTVLSILIKRKLNKILRNEGLDISPEQYVVLATLYKHGAMTLSEIANKTYKDNANVTRMVDLMEESNLVERTVNPDDRRSLMLILTEQGKEKFRIALSHVSELSTIYSQGLSESHKTKMKRMFATMIDNMLRADS